MQWAAAAAGGLLCATHGCFLRILWRTINAMRTAKQVYTFKASANPGVLPVYYIVLLYCTINIILLYCMENIVPEGMSNSLP